MCAHSVAFNERAEGPRVACPRLVTAILLRRGGSDHLHGHGAQEVALADLDA